MKAETGFDLKGWLERQDSVEAEDALRIFNEQAKQIAELKVDVRQIKSLSCNSGYGELALKEMMKPPIGLKPKWLHNEQRLNTVKTAMIRYFNTGLKLPIIWIEEYNELIKKQ